MTELSKIQGAFALPFAEQIAFFRQKVPLTDKSYKEMQAYEHDKAFVVAGAIKADLLNDLHIAVSKAIVEGESLGQFRARFDDIVKQRGWTTPSSSPLKKGEESAEVTKGGWDKDYFAWRTKIIYTTNLRTSHSAGRYKQMTTPEMLKARPYWQYRHVTRENPRQHHKRLNKKVLTANDGWWSVNYPPNGWGCNCYVRALSKADMEQLGLSVADTPDIDGYTQAGFEHAFGSTWNWRPDYNKYPPTIATALINSFKDEGISIHGND